MTTVVNYEVFRAFHSQHPEASLGLAITTDEERGGEHGIRYLFDDLGREHDDLGSGCYGTSTFARMVSMTSSERLPSASAS